jgi:hypothetical protein
MTPGVPARGRRGLAGPLRLAILDDEVASQDLAVADHTNETEENLSSVWLNEERGRELGRTSFERVEPSSRSVPRRPESSRGSTARRVSRRRGCERDTGQGVAMS